MKMIKTRFFLSCFSLLFFCCSHAQQPSYGVFTHQSDIGNVLHKGSVKYNGTEDTYTITGSGTNIWFSHDEFHYVWRKINGDFLVEARGSLLGKGVEAHRKLGWMIRSSLDTSAAMVCATVHGDGLTSLQYRKEKGSNVEEKRSAASHPDVIQLERKGNSFIMSVAQFGEPFVTEEITGIDLGRDVYVGLFVCAHNKDVTEAASFDNVRIVIPAKESLVPYRQYLGSHIEVMDVQSGHRQIVYNDTSSVQAPNWTRDGKYLVYNSNKGLLYRFDLKKRTSSLLNTGSVRNNNNDHVLSFDGKMIGLSSSGSDPKYGSIIYTVSLNGGSPKQITPTGPSYLHGWSPDGKFLVFTGQRNNEFDIYKVPSSGGPEVRLTTTPGLDDGSEYSPDGNYIYFNSVRSGTMQLWRMKPDGSDQEQLTSDEFNNWFPHVSPDGKTIVFLSFMKDVNPGDHPFYKHVYLRSLPITGGKPKVIAYLYGGQGTINTPSWSPDSKRIAFVSNSGNIEE